MKRAYSALALLAVLALSPRFAEAQGFGNSDGAYDASPGVTPMDFLGQADGCPIMAGMLYQQYLTYQQQTRQAGRNLDGNPQLSSTTGTSGSTSKPVLLSSGKKTKKKKRTTSTSSKSTATKKASARSTATDPAKKKMPQQTARPNPIDALS